MEYIVRSHRNAQVVFQYDPQYQYLYQEVTSVPEGIRGQGIVDAYDAIARRDKKSISGPIDRLIRDGLAAWVGIQEALRSFYVDKDTKPIVIYNR